MFTKWDPMPKPAISEDLACQIRQSNVAINIAEQEGDIRLMIQAMSERAELFKQAVSESSARAFA